MSVLSSQRARELGRFAVSGGGGLVLNLLILTALVELVGIREEYAALLSGAFGLLASFTATNWWVFDESPASNSVNGVLKRGIAYYAIMIGGKAINYVIYIYLLSLGVWYPAAWAIGSVVVFLATFSMNKMLWYRGVNA
jgi:putative flippase GtrA